MLEGHVSCMLVINGVIFFSMYRFAALGRPGLTTAMNNVYEYSSTSHF